MRRGEGGVAIWRAPRSDDDEAESRHEAPSRRLARELTDGARARCGAACLRLSPPGGAWRRPARRGQ